MFFVSDSIFAQSRNLTVAIIIDYEFPFSVGKSQTVRLWAFFFVTLVCVAIIYCVLPKQYCILRPCNRLRKIQGTSFDIFVKF